MQRERATGKHTPLQVDRPTTTLKTTMSTEIVSPAATWTPSDEPRLWRKLARVAARVTFADSLVSAWYCATDAATPAHVRAVLLGALAYFLLPADAVPDLLAGIGFADDASVIAAVVGTFARHITPEHRARARERLDQLLR
jgi:uncharacterized membrane protein YkvA (DUF1232 family)